MEKIQNIANLFLGNAVIKHSSETLTNFEAHFESTVLLFPVQINIDTALAALITGCSCKLYFTIGQSEALSYSSANYDAFLSDLKINYSGLDNGEVIILKVEIAKTINYAIPIICPNSLSIYFDKFDLESLLALFNTQFQNFNKILFLNLEIKGTIKTEGIAFSTPNDSDTIPNLQLEIKERIEKVQISSFSPLFSRFQLLPEHFFISQNEEFPFFDTLLKRLSLVILISSIFDITDINQNEFSYKLNGYKTITGKIDFKSITGFQDLDNYKKVYDWIYSSGSTVDKLGLSRNIISLHLKNINDFSLEGDIYNSILSAYKIYEKQNIKQYIEVRNKMSDQLIDYNKRASSIVESFASGFQKSSFAVITLYSSLIALRVLGTQSVTNGFLNYSTLLGIIFLSVSFIFMLITRWEVKQQKKRFQSSYNDFKLRYTDLLTIDDINKILNNDKEHISDIKFIKSKLKFYTLFWVVVLLSLFAFTLTYYFSEEMIGFVWWLIGFLAQFGKSISTL